MACAEMTVINTLTEEQKNRCTTDTKPVWYLTRICRFKQAVVLGQQPRAASRSRHSPYDA